ncbi:MAG: STT3 domain-containing protein [Euryarchaeota archaeon]|nr:STT3 domain-containing protein [Euryarchaeota archaeon]
MNKKLFFAILLLLFFCLYLRWNDQEVLTGADSYYHYRKADEVLNHRISDIDYLKNPPQGISYTKNFYHYFIAYTSKLVPFLTLEVYMVYLPLIFSLISVIIAYKIGNLFNFYSGVSAGFFIAVTPMIVERTNKTFADTDSLILLIVLLLCYLSLRLFMTKKTLYSLLIGLVLFGLQASWSGYWFYVYIFLGAVFIYALVEMRKKAVIQFLSAAGAYIIPATFYQWDTLADLLGILKNSHNDALQHQAVVQHQANGISLNVGELREVTREMLLSKLGIVLPLGILGCAVLVYLTYRERRYYPISLLLFSVLIPSALTLRGGERFLFLFAVPLILLSSIALGFVLKNLWRLKCRAAGIGIILILLLCAYQVRINSDITRPYADEDWREALQWVNENTEEDAVIISWWDYGYWIEALAERASYIDNGYRPNSKISWLCEMLTAETAAPLKDPEFDNAYILLTERELSHFEMISRLCGERLEYMVRFPRESGSQHKFSTFYEECLIFKRDGTIEIGTEGNFKPFNGTIYFEEEKKYKAVFSNDPLPSRIFIVKRELEKTLFTEMYLRNAETLPEIEMIKEFKKIKVFKIYIE